MISAAVGRGGETMISAQTIEALLERRRTREPLASASTARSGRT
jgi:hypothetical protein